MRREQRLQAILDHLQRHRVATAEALAEALGVSVRTVYRDIQALGEQGVAVEGEPGVGFALSGRVRLPPLMFSREELEALWLGTRMVSSWTDEALGAAARTAMERIRAVIPPHLERHLDESALFVPQLWFHEERRGPLAEVRRALEERRKLRLSYVRRDGQPSTRVVWPMALSFWGGTWLLSCWCELRRDFRSFRLDRIEQLTVTRERFREEPGRRLEDLWRALEHQGA